MKSKLILYIMAVGILLVASMSYVAVSSSQNKKQKAAGVNIGAAGLIVENAKIAVMNQAGSFKEAVAVKDGKIIAIGTSTSVRQFKGELTQIIDAKGRTVIPGLIDSHVHFVRQGNMPGIDIREAENTGSIQELLELLRKESGRYPPGSILTVMGGISKDQFKEKRLPYRQELSNALPDRPVYIQMGFSGPAVANDKALELFKSRGIPTHESGQFKKGEPSNQAFAVLKALTHASDKEAGLQRLMRYANHLGLTSVHDEGGVDSPGGGYFDTVNDYDALLALWRKDDLSIRFRIQHVVYDKTAGKGLLEDKLNHTWQGFGTPMLKYTTVGEHIVTFPLNGQVNPAYESKALKAAEDGWPHEQHSTSFDENKHHIQAIQSIHKKFPVTNLRWSLAHTFELGMAPTRYIIDVLKEMNMGLKLQNHAYIMPTDRFPLGRSLNGENAGPLYRTLLQTGLPLGAGTDGCMIVPLNPWYSIYYMVTGKDVSGKPVNPNETISRFDALRLYTLGSAWFSFEERQLGTLEVGKLADMVILNKDFFKIPEEEIKSVRAEVTFINGEKIYERR